MKQLKLILVVLFAIKAFTAIASETIAIHVETAGTLSMFIRESKKYQITNLKLTGNLDSRDIRLIRDMAGRDYMGNATSGKLTTLDLSGANIVSYRVTVYNSSRSSSDNSTCYYYSYDCAVNYHYYYHTTDNRISDRMFLSTKLTSITIPNSVTSIANGAFEGGVALKELHVRSLTPPDLGNNSFDCKLYIPKGSLQAYKHATGWREFTCIVEE